MKDELQIQLEMICHVQLWAKKQIAKENQLVDKINHLSISSIKQKLK